MESHEAAVVLGGLPDVGPGDGVAEGGVPVVVQHRPSLTIVLNPYIC